MVGGGGERGEMVERGRQGEVGEGRMEGVELREEGEMGGKVEVRRGRSSNSVSVIIHIHVYTYTLLW